MALIYASAVNKRINNHHHVSRCKRSTAESPNCGLQDILHGRQNSNEEGTNTDGDITRSISVKTEKKRRDSQHSVTTIGSSSSRKNSKMSLFMTGSVYMPKYRPVQRSKTSCSENKRKTTVPNSGGVSLANPRKISTPIMHSCASTPMQHQKGQQQSPLFDQSKTTVKKRVIQEYGLENGNLTIKGNHLEFVEFDDRRKSQSLDPDDWHKQVTLATAESDDDESNEHARKLSAFQRVRNKFSKWRQSKSD